MNMFTKVTEYIYYSHITINMLCIKQIHYGGGSQKLLDTMRFRYNEVNFEVTYYCQLKRNFDLKIELYMFEPHCVKFFDEPHPQSKCLTFWHLTY